MVRGGTRPSGRAAAPRNGLALPSSREHDAPVGKPATTLVIVGLITSGCSSARQAAPTTRPLGTATSTPTTITPPTTVPISPLPLQITKMITADLDGDGRPDTVSISGPAATAGPWTVRAVLATGVTDEQPLNSTYPYPATRILGAVDVNGDGHQEVLLRAGGETHTLGTLVAFAAGRLVVVGPTELGLFGWGAHSNCCPSDTEDVACLRVAGNPSLVTTTSQFVPDNWNGTDQVNQADIANTPPSRLRRAWTRTVYRLQAGRLTAVLNDHGRLMVGTPSPPDVPLNNELRCGATVLGEGL
jgi:hypothetical protein